jgi:SPX domain protein involved in polyphosphate accumulation
MWRFEKKFVIEHKDYTTFCRDLSLAGYYKVYPDRIVNSIYFDDESLTSYYENIDGQSRRTKYRLRFYGNSYLGEGVWEQKIKWIDTNYKKVEPFADENRHLRQLRFPGHENLRPLVHVQYQREYFYSEKDGIRVTIDKKINYINIASNRIVYDHSLIVEYKCSNEILITNAPSILSNLSRSSKYCKAISAHNIAGELY